MRRREFIAGLGGAAAWPLAARAQQDNRVRRVGVLIGARNESDPITKARLGAFQEGLAKFGWAENRNLHLDVRFAGGDADRIRTSAAELVRLSPDAVVAGGVAEEDARRLHRERDRLVSERVQHVNRIKGLCALQGIYDYHPLRPHAMARLEQSRTAQGVALPPRLKSEIKRELHRLETEFIQAQMKELAEQAKELGEAAAKIAMKSVPPKS
jgi:hypothetical protein